MSVRERARLSAIALGLGGAALALIQILENTVSAFSPRPVVSALLTVTVAMAGVSLARARSLATRQQFLTSVLWTWPLPTAAQADPLTLGIFPPRFVDGPYVPRSIDSTIERALAERALVLVIGPARAGKSRTAYEAVARSLPDRRVLNPIDGEALRSIVGDSGLSRADGVWWLDDLDRHLSSLDGRALDEILTGGHVVVASLRDEAWQALLAADGTTGAQGRRLLGAAHTIHLPAAPDAEEVAAAARLYPEVDVTGGIGAALSADGSSSRASTPSVAAEAPPRRRPDFPLAGALAATLVLAAVFGLTTAAGGFSNPGPPPPIAEQLGKMVAQNSAAGLALVYHHEADLHGPGNQSWIYVWRSPYDQQSPTHSDRIQIYDDVDGRLKLHLDFSPSSSRLPNTPLTIDHRTIALVDLDGTDQQREFVAAYVPDDGCSCLPAGFELPLMAAWNGSTGRYVLSPLLPRDLPPIPPEAPPPHATPSLEPWLSGYYHLTDSQTHLQVAANAVSSFALVPARHGKHGKPALLAVLGQTGSDSKGAVFIYEFDRQLANTHDAPQPSIMCDRHQPVGEEFVRFMPFKSNAHLPEGAPLYEYTQQLAKLAPRLDQGTLPSTSGHVEKAHDDPCVNVG